MTVQMRLQMMFDASRTTDLERVILGDQDFPAELRLAAIQGVALRTTIACAAAAIVEAIAP